MSNQPMLSAEDGMSFKRPRIGHQATEQVTGSILPVLSYGPTGATDTQSFAEDRRWICFGMIKSFTIVPLDPTYSYVGDALFSSPDHVLSKQGSKLIGSIEAKEAAILQSLAEDPDIDLQLLCRLQSPRELEEAAQSRNKSTGVMSLDIIIYGKMELFEDVGDLCEEQGIHLQDPIGCDRAVEYRNPHYLSSDDPKPVLTSSLLVQPQSHVSERTGDFATFLDGFENGLELEEAVEPRALSTSLKRHQKQALVFMRKRELGWNVHVPHADVWSSELSSTGMECFINNITDHRQYQKPEQFRGGILADPMGLGKSLSMISLLVSESHSPQNAGRIERQGRNQTLLVVPSTLINNWEEEVKKHIHPGYIKFYRHHGRQRLKSTAEASVYDVVITSFQTLSSEWKQSTRSHKSVLFSTLWHRVVLDEAHSIRHASTIVSEAVRSIEARCRWAITGTPIQNKLSDLTSLLQFLRVYPYKAPHTFTEDFIQPWKEGHDELAVSRLKKLLGFIMLRRSQSTIQLPPRHDLIYYLTFTPEEREYHNSMTRQTAAAIDHHLGHANGTRSYFNALQRVNALRMICNLGLTYQFFKEAPLGITSPELSTGSVISSAQGVFEDLISAGQVICGTCMETITITGTEENLQPRITDCLFIWCGQCSQTPLPGVCIGCARSPACSWERVSVNPLNTQDQQGRFKSYSGELPTKLQALQKDILTVQGTKSLVLSFWTSTLDLVEVALKRSGIKYLRFDGQVAQKHRANILQQFESDPEVKVLLLSISCGAIGLNLTAASRAYLMEAQWNPTIEAQALARIHRIGQTKEVTTIRFIMKDSFEEHVLKVQDRKIELADLLLSKKNKDMALSRLQQLRSMLN